MDGAPLVGAGRATQLLVTANACNTLGCWVKGCSLLFDADGGPVQLACQARFSVHLGVAIGVVCCTGRPAFV